MKKREPIKVRAGDAVAKAAAVLGFKQCVPCKQRQKSLNRIAIRLR